MDELSQKLMSISWFIQRVSRRINEETEAKYGKSVMWMSKLELEFFLTSTNYSTQSIPESNF